ncbi:hypothetical protein IMZ48_49660 [Candidatus Bathyarchaeota archaeon]|nr:hypothetical protein [Candidatus Bathyarchaeota archaeon]
MEADLEVRQDIIPVELAVDIPTAAPGQRDGLQQCVERNPQPDLLLLVGERVPSPRVDQGVQRDVSPIEPNERELP